MPIIVKNNSPELIMYGSDYDFEWKKNDNIYKEVSFFNKNGAIFFFPNFWTWFPTLKLSLVQNNV